MNFLNEPADVRTPAKFANYYKIPYATHDDKSDAANKYRDHQYVASVLNVIVAKRPPAQGAVGAVARARAARLARHA